MILEKSMVSLKDVGLRIKNRREILRMTQLDLGSAIHTSRSNVARYEAGDVDLNLSTLKKLAESLHCTVAFLADDDFYDKDEFEISMEAQMRNLPPMVQASFRAAIGAAYREMLKDETTHGRKAE